MKKYQYESRKGSPFKKEHVQEIGEFINNIPNKTTDNILNVIENNPKHVIHQYLEWDDTIAAQKHRLQQVRNIVNHIEVTITRIGNSTPIPVFVSITQQDGKSYQHISDVMNNVEMKKQIINRAKTELNNWMIRHQSYTELQGIIKLIKSKLN